jgi:hypothetical protein
MVDGAENTAVPRQVKDPDATSGPVDSLGRCSASSHRAFHPSDNRIISLSLFHRTDHALGHDVQLAL